MNTANTPYTFGMATGEIISLLLLSFVVGILLCRLLRQMGICCLPKKKTIPLGITPVPAGKYHTRDFDIHTPNLRAKPVTPAPELELPQFSRPQPVTDVYIPKVSPKPTIALPEVTPKTVVDVPVMHGELPPLPEIDPLLAAIDPHKPILDLVDVDNAPEPEITLEIITMPNEPMPTASWTLDPLLAEIDPHKPIIDPPDMPETTMKTDPLLDAIDPHKPIIDPPDMPETNSNQGSTDTPLNILNDWLHKAKDSVEHLTEKATPTANEWLHKAKDSVEHLTEKATPTANEWLHKAKEIGNDLGSKGSSLSAETLTKGSSTLASLAASAKELTEKLASNLSIKHDDLQKLVGIGPTFASILHRAGIHTYQQLAETSHQKLQALLIVEDEQFSQHDTSSWPQQAALAARGEWEQLKTYQDSL
ncbi:hypothetical protein [Thiothrix subterranea]|uniref:DUF4332 domain-containing protein n=1 Tax=Thiothrix subterranea TaxID=2735563 RepID=A0AA51MN20_9GAMM|nr:hypothetical protein [Thiothrix subterranea]MDQ5768157.1 hypothetical protein [Thiothrix subterranea]WML85337.1 hypothetical protein RCG00_13640 [Thiothrix subterranea]